MQPKCVIIDGYLCECEGAVNLPDVLPTCLMRTAARASECCLHDEQTFALDKLSIC